MERCAFYQIFLSFNSKSIFFHFFSKFIHKIYNTTQKVTKKGDTIFIKTEKEDKFVKIIIKDTGVGIPKEDLNRIFFTTKSTGLGLGLACVKRVIREHHGKMRLKVRNRIYNKITTNHSYSLWND
ncbi:MAG: hypothetical protein C0190_06615 [Thermodesulfobacterium geofontis]|uniref:histidine kinase n=1 Tax=Thermodesulfobacterium geofontis TaxID=1295609 RepID=A0A2N7PM39_9BACT|nr:MAG: hypothetical protein C0190_06615 [Thermodesulfobacterium geofontis]